MNIALVTRYKTAKEKREIFNGLAEGKVDIVVGTHALLSEKNHFKDLGLLIVDEEQKFGVKQKERLREFRLSVDTLSMSATPIPRSLHLSMTGVRNLLPKTCDFYDMKITACFRLDHTCCDS